jgi:hypothetical protein
MNQMFALHYQDQGNRRTVLVAAATREDAVRLVSPILEKEGLGEWVFEQMNPLTAAILNTFEGKLIEADSALLRRGNTN